MPPLEYPRLRVLPGQRIDQAGRSFVRFDDPFGAFRDPVLIPTEKVRQILRHCDGKTLVETIRKRVESETGCPLSFHDLEGFFDRLDRAMVLDGPTFAAYRRAYAEVDVHPSTLAGFAYPADPEVLRLGLDRCFDHPSGAGLPKSGSHDPMSNLRGILSPHIDFGRGGPTYSWAYKELLERSDAEVFVILGVAHQPCRHRFALTRKDFQTPLGVARTDQKFVGRVAGDAGLDLFEDELTHRSEHSIEHQVVFLQHVLGGKRDFQIVPILVGSFHDLMVNGVDPIEDSAVDRMVAGLRQAEVASGKKVAYIGGIDLCHVGPEFGDPAIVDDSTLAHIRDFDDRMIRHAVGVDPSAWFAEAAQVQNRWRVCGLAATYVMLHAIGPAQGRLLRYDQAVNPSRTCCVSFASVAFDSPTKA